MKQLRKDASLALLVTYSALLTKARNCQTELANHLTLQNNKCTEY